MMEVVDNARIQPQIVDKGLKYPVVASQPRVSASLTSGIKTKKAPNHIYGWGYLITAMLQLTQTYAYHHSLSVCEAWQLLSTHEWSSCYSR